ncbi:hypothetical protein EUX98_g1522 [Antrodiella citrinella]|uniref:Uncharacterized protein n=1 Tax=Antrodiella citrinella TaxID=2447956 RepID=A0A4S4N2T3_9APHY|nr:hypothetical protein EUX98_g1522 [Antrodiella citrinella]
MVVQNTTVSHVSPSISYIPGMLWFEGIPADDPDLSYYDTQSYHATNGTMGAASVSFHWDGLGEVWVFGGWRERLGSYNVTLDGATTEVNGFQGGADNFDAVLFHGIGLLPGKHQIELVNTGNDTQHSVLDINHITFQSSLGDPSIIDDTDSRCMWSGEWVPNNVSRTTWDSLGQMWMNFSALGSNFGDPLVL